MQAETPEDYREIFCVNDTVSPGVFVEWLAWPAGRRDGPLAGVGVAFKDMIDFAGRAPSLGLARPPRPVPLQTATVGRMIMAAGANILGFTEMTPLAFEPSGANPFRQRPANPWAGAYICGGSSSGSAVAVATGMADVALGSDTGGSLRIPAHCCGVVAWKPSYATIPVAGTMALAPSLDTLGFLAPSAAALAPFVELFAGGVQGEIGTVAVAADLVKQSARPIQQAMLALEQALSMASLKSSSIALAGLLDACDAHVLAVMQGEAARTTADIVANELLEPNLAKRLAKGMAISDASLDDARTALRQLAFAAQHELFSDAGAIILPVMPIVTPLVSACEPGQPGFSGRTLYALSSFTRFVNGLGWPAIALPIGFDGDGMPIGCQIIGPPGSDAALLRLATRVQSVSEWHRRRPDGQRTAGNAST